MRKQIKEPTIPLPKYVWNFIPMFQYDCPQCGNTYYWWPKNQVPTECNKCHFKITEKHKRPPAFVKDRKETIAYLRRFIFPQIPVTQIVKLKECLPEL